ncbi:MAG: PKD domain-containing protein [Bacteroidia bacterium]
MHTNYLKRIIRLVLGVIIICCIESKAQQTTTTNNSQAPRFSEEFTHNANHLFDWHDVEGMLRSNLNIDAAESNSFLRYASRKNLLNYANYLTKVKEGSITTKAEALDYWKEMLPSMEALYKKQSGFYSNINTIPFNVLASNCNNLDFAIGTHAGWSGRWCSVANPSNFTTLAASLPTSTLDTSTLMNQPDYVHEIMTAGTDPFVPISKVAPGHTYSLRLGSSEAYGKFASNGPYNHQIIKNTFVVSATNPSITYWYAVVFSQNLAQAHPQSEQPYFKIRVFDQNGNAIDCASYDVDIEKGVAGGFKLMPIIGSVPGQEAVYKDWVPVNIPLINYIGQQVTIQFESSDCNAAGHFGYAYLAVDCSPFKAITTKPFICGVDTAVLIAPSGVYSYLWTGPGIISAVDSSSIVINKPGKYSVAMTVVGNGGKFCVFNIDTIITGVVNLPTAFFSNLPTCSNLPMKFVDKSTPTGAITSWSWDFTNDGIEDKNDQNPLYSFPKQGIYPVKLTIMQGPCEATITKDVIVDPGPALLITNPNAVCSPIKIDITTKATTAGSTNINSISYWRDLGCTVVLNNPNMLSVGGTYYIKAVSSLGCVDIQPVTVIIDPIPVLSITNPPAVCFPNTVDITVASITLGSTGGGTFSYWTNANATNTLIAPNAIKASGTYYIKITSLGGCSDIKPVIVTIHSLPIADAGFDLATCSGQTTGKIGADAIVNQLYSWSPITGLSDSQISNPSVTITNNKTVPELFLYTLTVTNSITNCKSVDDIKVTINPQPVLNIINPLPICYPNTANITTAIITAGSTGGGTLSYWVDALATIPLINPTAINASGTYFIKAINTNCVDIRPITVKINTPPIANAGADVELCTGASSILGTSPVIDYTYLWQLLDNTFAKGLSNNSIANPSVSLTNGGSSPITSVYVLKTTNSLTSCSSTDTVNVLVNALATANAGSNQSLCMGSAIKLNGSIGGAATVGKWSGGAGTYNPSNTSLQALYTPTKTECTAGFVKLTLTTDDPVGSCTIASSDVLISFYKDPIVKFAIDAPNGCLGKCVNFYDSTTVSGGDIVSWEWNFGDTSPNGKGKKVTHCYTQSGVYDITVTAISNHGCKSNLMKPKLVEIFQKPKAEFFASPNPTTILDTKVTLLNQSSKDVVYWHYTFGDGAEVDSLTANPVHLYLPKTPATYLATLLVKNADGCVDSISHEIVIHPEFTFYIPNAFSPNDDGLNDVFLGRGIGIKKYNFWIYDRWGNIIFNTEDIDEGWDGGTTSSTDNIIDGSAGCLQDVYVWKVRVIDIIGKIHDYKGIVTLIK